MGIDYDDDDIDDIIVDNDDNDENDDDNGDQIMAMMMTIVVPGNCAIVGQWALPSKHPGPWPQNYWAAKHKLYEGWLKSSGNWNKYYEIVHSTNEFFILYKYF